MKTLHVSNHISLLVWGSMFVKHIFDHIYFNNDCQAKCNYPLGKISVYKYCFCYLNVPTTGTRPFVSTANEALVGT